ncbi:MAG: SDR family oxidoreductase, partial [Planctomycetes bacterium]|nr:SDR family oxidoreductase [Planctomycetota bacterium]
MIDLKGQKALVTGGTRGIGKAIALELAKHGCDVALNYLRNRAAAAETANEIEAATGIKPLLLKCNVADEDSVKEMCAKIKEEWGHLDIFISNAASGVLKPGMELTKHHWEWTVNINAGALIWLMQGVVPLMEGRKGRVVATSSLGSIRAFEFYHAVGASKGALESLVRHFAVELGPRGIRCNVVNAGVVDTDALQHFPNREEMLENTVKDSPMKRLVTPEDVAK